MVLVDTSVWVLHLSRGEPGLADLLNDGLVLCHPFIIGELACGRMRNRAHILTLLAALPQARLAHHDELLGLIEQHQLHGRGLGWIDVHLVGSSLLSSCKLWTSDNTLRKAAHDLGIDTDPGKTR